MKNLGWVLIPLLAGCATTGSQHPAPSTESEEAWARMAKEHPDSSIPHIYNGYAALKRGDQEAFEASYEAAVGRADDGPEDALALGTLCLAAARQESRRDHRSRLLKDARRWLESARSGAPEEPSAAFNLGLVYYLQKRLAEATAQLQSYASKVPEDRSALRLIAQCYLDQDEPTLALQWVQRPSPGEAMQASDWELVGRCRYMLHQFDRAETAYRRSVELDPNRPWVWNNLGLTLQELGKSEEADRCFEQSRTLRKTPR